MLCFVVLCYIMLYYVMLCYVMLCYVMLTVPSASARTSYAAKSVSLIKTNAVHLHRSLLKMRIISAPILIPFLIYIITTICRQSCRFMRKDGRTDSTKLIVAFLNCFPDVSKTRLREKQHNFVGCIHVAEYRHLVQAFVTTAMKLR